MRALAPLLLVSLIGCDSQSESSTVARSEYEATGEEHYFDWTRPAASTERLVERQRALTRSLRSLDETNRGIFLAPSSPGRSDGGTYREQDDFLYLCGLELPDSVLAIEIESDRSILFTPDRDARFESPSRVNDFPGRALGLDPRVRAAAGVDEVRSTEEFERALGEWIDDARPLWLVVGRTTELPGPAEGWVRWRTPAQSLQAWIGRSWPAAKLGSAYPALAALRSIKDPGEIETLRRASAITCDAIRVAAREIRPGVDERSLEGTLEAAFKHDGAQRPAFDSIIKSGPNSVWPWRILAAHYDRRNRALASGELVIFDVGCELDHYASDIGRTFPVSGRFDAEQRRLVEMVTRASDATLAAIRPGVTFADLRKVLLDEIPERERPHMQAALFFGHHLGLDVGDPSLSEYPLEPGMTFTVEPWYYDHQREVAVFIEDVVLVTSDGCENLSAALPRSADELERLVGR